MKKNRFWKLMLALTTILSAITFAGCKNEEEDKNTYYIKEQTYYGEVARITKSDYQTFSSRYNSTSAITYSLLKEARSTLKTYNEYDFASNAGIKRSEMLNFLTQHGFTPLEAESSLNDLDKRGNLLQFYNYKYSNDYIIWIYIEKE